MSKSRAEQIKELENDWATNPRWANVKRDYSAEDVVRYAVVYSLNIPLHEEVLRTFGKK